jgi:SAM-dependent methyltransferase
MDSITWARAGAEVVGLDFSPDAVATATRLARDVGVADRATFVEASVYDAREVLDGSFDIVYVTWGALIWLPDVERWAAVVASLLAPGGFLYLAEAHPFAGCLHPIEGEPGRLHQLDPYGDSTQMEWDEPGTYADPDAPTENTRSFEWAHGLGQIVSAVASAGLRLDFLHERPELVWQMWPTMEQGDDGCWRQPGTTFPLSFSLKATQPR